MSNRECRISNLIRNLQLAIRHLPGFDLFHLLFKEQAALLKTELCDKVSSRFSACALIDLGSPVLNPDPWCLLRKEVIQPQVPLRLPCYDFIPITSHTFGTF